VSNYGTRATCIRTGARSAADLGIRFGGDLTEAEVDYPRSEEWAMTAEDVLWRRSKLGLTFTEAEAEALGDWMADQPVSAHPVT
jgi:glycerol-3-phosphate dehydrogenase